MNRMPNYPSPFPLPLSPERVETPHHVVEVGTREPGDGMMPRAFVRFDESWAGPAALAPVVEVVAYRPADRTYPSGSILAVGRGDCPLWFDLSRVVIHR